LNHKVTLPYFQSFLAQFKGVEGITDNNNLDNDSTKEIEQCLMEMEIETKNYLTELGEINGTQIVAILNDQSTLYVVIRKDPFEEAEPNEMSVFIFDNCYSLNTFQGIMPDSGIAGVSTAGNP
jgi:hypothetical protein